MSDVRPITQNFARPSYRPQQNVGLDPDMKRMIVTAGGVGAGLALLIGVFSFAGHMRPHGIPVIAAPEKPVRVKPLNPGGMQVAGGVDTAADGAEKLAPEAEKPAIRALHARRLEKTLHEVVETPVKPEDPPIVAPPAAAKPALPVIAASPAKPVAPSGNTAVQLAAFESRGAAEQDWDKLSEKLPALFNGHTPHLVQAKLANRTVYQLRTGGFANTDAARSFCAEVRAKGGDCSIATF